MSNNNLIKSKIKKNDEFYTQYKDIEKEIKNYPPSLFYDKTIYCNCDNFEFSNFVNFFHDNFKHFKLKALYSSYLDTHTSPIYYYNGKEEKLYYQCSDDPKYIHGDFRNKEMIKILKECDIVVTNPPFSLFKNFMNLILENNKDFLVIGNKNAFNYLCPYFKENKIRLGYTQPNDFILENESIHSLQGLCRWFTSFPVNREIQSISFVEKDISSYQKFDNYDAINVNKMSEIPDNYYEPMGVPITFLDRYNPGQFKILGITYSTDRNPDIEKIRIDKKHRHVGIINGKEKYPRIIIQRRVGL